MDRPNIGHGIAGALGVVAQHITDRIDLDVYFEPMPASDRAIHLTIIPRTFDVRREERRRMGLHDLYTALLSLDITLSAVGTGQEFMAECMEGALLVARLFDDAVSVHLGAEIYATLSCTRKDSGQFMQSEEEGSQDYVYVENWEGSLLFPYVFEADQPDRVTVPPGLWPVTVSVSP